MCIETFDCRRYVFTMSSVVNDPFVRHRSIISNERGLLFIFMCSSSFYRVSFVYRRLDFDLRHVTTIQRSRNFWSSRSAQVFMGVPILIMLSFSFACEAHVYLDKHDEWLLLNNVFGLGRVIYVWHRLSNLFSEVLFRTRHLNVNCGEAECIFSVYWDFYL